MFPQLANFSIKNSAEVGSCQRCMKSVLQQLLLTASTNKTDRLATPFFILRFALTIICGSRRAAKFMEGLREFITWVISSGRRVGGDQPQIILNTLEQSCPQCLVPVLAVKHSILANWTMNCSRTCWINHVLHPPISTSHPPDIIHVINAPRLSSLFAALPLPCIIINANWRMSIPQRYI